MEGLYAVSVAASDTSGIVYQGVSVSVPDHRLPSLAAIGVDTTFTADLHAASGTVIIPDGRWWWWWWW